MKMRFSRGDILFRQGDPSDFACAILEGAVEVIKEAEGEEMVLGQLGPGDFVGEMGVVDGKPRSATVRALSAVTVEAIAAESFVATISADPVAATKLLSRLSERVRTLTEENMRLRHGDDTPTPLNRVEGAPVPDPATSATGKKIASYAQAARIGTSEHGIGLSWESGEGPRTVWIDFLPFMIGRAPEDFGPFRHEPRALLLPDHPPYRLSPMHFVIARDPRQGLIVRDLGSELGTTVNGQYLGGIFAKDSTYLSDGDSQIVAGGQGSPFIFRVRVRG